MEDSSILVSLCSFVIEDMVPVGFVVPLLGCKDLAVSYLVHVSTGDAWCRHIVDICDGCQRPQIIPSDRIDVEMFEDVENIFMPDQPYESLSSLDDQRTTPKAPPVLPVNDACNC